MNDKYSAKIKSAIFLMFIFADLPIFASKLKITLAGDNINLEVIQDRIASTTSRTASTTSRATPILSRHEESSEDAILVDDLENSQDFKDETSAARTSKAVATKTSKRCAKLLKKNKQLQKELEQLQQQQRKRNEKTPRKIKEDGKTIWEIVLHNNGAIEFPSKVGDTPNNEEALKILPKLLRFLLGDNNALGAGNLSNVANSSQRSELIAPTVAETSKNYLLRNSGNVKRLDEFLALQRGALEGEIREWKASNKWNILAQCLLVGSGFAGSYGASLLMKLAESPYECFPGGVTNSPNFLNNTTPNSTVAPNSTTAPTETNAPAVSDNCYVSPEYVRSVAIGGGLVLLSIGAYFEHKYLKTATSHNKLFADFDVELLPVIKYYLISKEILGIQDNQRGWRDWKKYQYSDPVAELIRNRKADDEQFEENVSNTIIEVLTKQNNELSN